MARLFVVHCPALSFELATRGDATLHIPDLIADGGLAPVEGDVQVTTDITLRETDIETLDKRIGELREKARADGAEMIVVSDSVILSSVPHAALEPGNVVKNVAALLKELAG